jgi:hypothetical protein
MDTLINMVDYIPTETMEKDLQEAKQLLGIFQLADWKGVKVLDGMIVENRLQELRQIKSKIEEQLRFRNGVL